MFKVDPYLVVLLFHGSLASGSLENGAAPGPQDFWDLAWGDPHFTPGANQGRRARSHSFCKGDKWRTVTAFESHTRSRVPRWWRAGSPLTKVSARHVLNKAARSGQVRASGTFKGYVFERPKTAPDFAMAAFPEGCKDRGV